MWESQRFERGMTRRTRDGQHGETDAGPDEQIPASPAEHVRSPHAALSAEQPPQGNGALPDVPFFVKDGRCYRRMNAMDILYIEVRSEQVKLCCRDRDFTLHGSMRGMMLQLPSNMFCMVSRKQAVNMRLIESIGAQHVIVAGQAIVLKPMFRSQLLNMLPILRNR
jgi:hypothetical protein